MLGSAKVSPQSSSFGSLVEVRKRRKLYIYHRCPEQHNGSTIIFYHGAGGSHVHFLPQLEHFPTQGYEVICADMLGHGASERPAESSAYTFSQYSYDALALFDRYCNAGKRNILMGHSYGTSLCTLVYTERKSKVSEIVLMSGGGPFALSPDPVSIFSLPSFLLACIRPILTSAFRKVAFHSDDQSAKVKDSDLLSVDSRVLKHVMKGQIWDEGDEAYHALITCPVLLILGKYDKFIPLQDEFTMAETIPRAVLHILKGGHMLPLECQDEVNHIVEKFLLNESVGSPVPIKKNTFCPDKKKQGMISV